jgi:hypothetical protein
MLGYSAAMGKVGAAIGTQVFEPMQAAIGGVSYLEKGSHYSRASNSFV